MFLGRLLAILSLCFAAAGQTPPVEYATFMSHGKPISCVVYEAPDALATIILLPGSGPSDLGAARMQANFFAGHGFRVLVADYLSATPKAAPSPANYRRWAQVVEDIVEDLRARPGPRNKKIALVGQDLGASVALLAGSHKIDVGAIAEWSGLLPNQFFSQVAKSASFAHRSWRAGPAGSGSQCAAAGPPLRAQGFHLRSRDLSR